MTITGSLFGSTVCFSTFPLDHCANSCVPYRHGISSVGRKRKRLTQLVMQSSVQDSIAIFVPYIFIFGIAVITLSLSYHPTMALFLYWRLPESYKTGFWACLSEEFRMMTLSIAIPSLFCCVPKEHSTIKRFYLFAYLMRHRSRWNSGRNHESSIKWKLIFAKRSCSSL